MDFLMTQMTTSITGNAMEVAGIDLITHSTPKLTIWNIFLDIIFLLLNILYITNCRGIPLLPRVSLRLYERVATTEKEPRLFCEFLVLFAFAKLLKINGHEQVWLTNQRSLSWLAGVYIF
jgi:hypothetical protein